MNKLKRPVFLLLTAGILCATGTAAYFSDFEKKINSVAVGYVTTEIEEDFPDPTPTPMENGPSYRKEIRIGNFSGSVKGFQADCYVRMSLSYSNDDIGRGVKLTGLDTANWVYNSQDGYYYYRKKISEGEKTTPLCTGFQIDPQKIDDTYRDSIKDFEINVYEEAVQAEGFSDYESAWRYFSDPVSAQAERRGECLKKHLKALLAGAAVAGSILACTAAYARFSDSVTVTNHISVGDINISLRELEKKDGREMKYQDRRIVLPGDEISKIPRITNHSEPCWVRVKISYTDDLEGLDGLDDRNLTGMSPRWIRKGEYFYYTRKLEQGDSVDIFTGVTVPSQWDESYQDKKLGITIVADAVQAANFAPDFRAMSPWGNQKILRCIHDTDGLVVQKKSPVDLKVEFEGNAHKLIAAPEDFFSGFSTAMPGDVFHDSVEIRNTTEHAAEIFFRTSPECKSVKDQEFLKKLKLVITMNDKKLYSGDLLAASLNKAVSLGEFSSGEKGNMRFEVTVPAELDNLYALRAADVKWIFSVEEDQETADTSPVPRRNGRKEATERASGNNSSSVRTTPVKTGDESPVILFALMAGIALLTCSLTLWKGGRKN